MREINLNNNVMAFVDDEDFDRVNKFKWYAKSVGKNKVGFYAARNFHFIKSDGSPTGRTVFMHRFILGVENVSHKDNEIDHKNNNTLDNRKINLRISTRSQNCVNRRNYMSITGFRGVSVRPSGRFAAAIKINQKAKVIGTFDTAELAAKAYDEKAKELFGEFANLNFKS